MQLQRHGWDIHALSHASRPASGTYHQSRQCAKTARTPRIRARTHATRHPKINFGRMASRREYDPPGRPGSAQEVPRKQRSLGSERGLATPSPDGKGEITLGPSLKIMPLDPYSTLGRSCEPAYQVDLPVRRLRGDVTRWLAAVRAGRTRGELLAHLAGKLTRGPAGRSRPAVREVPLTGRESMPVHCSMQFQGVAAR